MLPVSLGCVRPVSYVPNVVSVSGFLRPVSYVPNVASVSGLCSPCVVCT